MASPVTYWRTPAACGVISIDLRRMALPPGNKPGGERKLFTLNNMGKTTRDDSAGNVFETLKIPNGSPDVTLVGPSTNPPRLVSQVRAVYERFCLPRKRVSTREPLAFGTDVSFTTSSHSLGILLVLITS